MKRPDAGYITSDDGFVSSDGSGYVTAAGCVSGYDVTTGAVDRGYQTSTG